MTHIRKQRTSHRVRLRFIAAIAVAIAAGAPVVAILGLGVVDPPITTVQVQRWIEHPEDQRRYSFVPIDRMSPSLVDAVIASEDARFFDHHGLDWIEIEKAMETRSNDGRMRGASTITQQLARNLFLTTNRSVVRKALEIPLALLVDLLLSKRRILELYLNVVEWGPGIFGAEAAARHHYGVAADQLSDDQAVRLAAILPSPRHRSPEEMHRSAQRIRARMRRSSR